jgi:hypothetical protein
MKMNKSIKTTMSLATIAGLVPLAGVLLAVPTANAATLLHHWEFENNLTDSEGLLDVSGGTPTYVAGKFGQALSVNGNDRVTTGSSPWAVATNAAVSNISYGGWMKLVSSSGASSNIMGFQDSARTGTWIRIDGANTPTPNFFGRVNGPGEVMSTPAGSVTVNDWHHVIMTVSSGDGMKLYVDGNVAASNAAGTLFDNGTDWWIGHDTFTGSFDDMAIWDGVLTSTEVGNAQLSGAASFAVPEPSTTALLGLGGLALILRRRK